MKMSDEQAAQILTVGQAVDFVLAHGPPSLTILSPANSLTHLLDELPEDLHRQVFTHASWTERRRDSYTRLAFLGDSVLGAGDHRAPVPAPGGRALRRRAG